MQSSNDVGADRLIVTVYGDWAAAFLKGSEKVGAAQRELKDSEAGITEREIVEGFKDHAPELGTRNAIQVMTETAAAARQGYRRWDAVRVGAGLRIAVPGTRPTAVARAVRRTPSGSKARGSNRRRASTSSRGSPRSDDDEPEPPRAATRHSVIACPLEVDLLFHGAAAGEIKRAGCAYCEEHTRGVRGSVLAWFLSHPCRVDEGLARRNRELIRRQGGLVLEVAA